MAWVFRRLAAVAACVATLLASACGNIYDNPSASIFDPVWLKTDAIYLLRNDGTMWLQQGRDAKPVEFDPQLGDACPDPVLRELGRLPGQRLSITAGCSTMRQDQVFGYDPATGESELLLFGNLYDPVLVSDMSRGYGISFRANGCRTIVEFTPPLSTAPLLLDDCGSIPPTPTVASCERQIAWSPRVAADGTLYYLGTSSKVSSEMDNHWALCRDHGGVVEQIGVDFVGFGSIDVTDDGAHVIVGIHSEGGSPELYLVSTNTGERTKVKASGDASYPSFSPDGRQVVYVSTDYRLGFADVAY
jgi:hypothetical protein